MVHSTTTAVDAGTRLASTLYDSAIASVRDFAASPHLETAAASAFGSPGVAVAIALRGFESSGWPHLVLVEEDVLHGARAAYARDSDTIFLSRQFLAASHVAPAAVTAVLVEELGHAIDARVNAVDAVGDEGEIFAAFVLGQAVDATGLAALRAENDHGTIQINGTATAVEFAGEIVGSITLDGSLADWTAAEQIDSSLSLSAYDIYAKATDGSYVFALKAPVAIGANTTVWMNTDQNASTGYQIWGFAGGAEYNIDFDATGTPRLYTGDAGQTLVSGASVSFGYSADRTIVEFAVASSAIGSPGAINTLWDINNNTFLPTDFSATQYAVLSAAPPPAPAPVVGSVTLDGDLSDWTTAEQVDRSLSVSGYEIYAKSTDGSYVFALKAPVAIGANTTAWLNTDQDASSGYQIWGFAGGAEYNINFDASGTPRLYTGDAGQTLVAGAAVAFGYSADRSVVEFAISENTIGSPGAINTLWDINNNTFLPTDFSVTQYAVVGAAPPPPPSAPVVGSITLDGDLSDWTAADQIDSSLSLSGYDIYAKATDGSYVFALQAPVAIGATTTTWLNTDQNASTGYQIWGFAGGAEYNINFDANGTPRLYTGADGQTLVAGATVSFGSSADRTVVEFAVASSAIGSPAAINTLWDINNNTFLPTDYSLTQFAVRERAPVIVSNGGAAAAAISVAENVSAVTTVTATDPEGQTVSYAISGGADAAHFAIDAQTGVLTFRTAPDFEAPGDAGANNVYDVTVSARDSAGETDTQALIVTVMDVAGLTLTGDAAPNTLTGTPEQDALSGLGGNDTLIGDAGRDVLNGGAGADSMSGGPGDDIYEVDNIGDVITESTGAGRDLVGASITYTLPAHVEDLSLTGTAAIDGTGNSLVNMITGNAAANTLDGGAGDDAIDAGRGDDVLIGGAGSDTLRGGAGSDRFYYDALTEGVDRIPDFIVGYGGDMLDLRDVLVGYNGATSNIDDFVRLSGDVSTTVSVNEDGAGTDFVPIATLDEVAMSASLLDEMLAQGNVILPGQSEPVPLAVPVSDVVATAGNPFIDGLVQGSAWQFSDSSRILTYSFSRNDTLEGAWRPWVMDAVTQAFAQWANVANFTPVEAGSGSVFTDSTADIAVTPTGSELQRIGALSLGVFPSPEFVDTQFLPLTGYTRFSYEHPEGDVFFDSGHPAFESPAPGTAGFALLLHEIGHALGLKHTYDDGANGRPTFNELGIGSYENDRQTLMSLTSNVALNTNAAATPMPLDILAIQSIYGANMSYRTGDDAYDAYTTHDERSNTTSWAPYKRTIWDAGGTDLLAASFDTGAGVTLDLRPGAIMEFSTGAVVAIAYNTIIENAYGTRYDDVFIGNDADNEFSGNGGNDRMEGGAGNDTYRIAEEATLVELPGDGIDTVISFRDYVLGSNLENLTLMALAVNGTGNELDNTIIGSFSQNVLQGGTGDDFLDGGMHADTMHGGSGNDTYIVDVTNIAAPQSYLELRGDPGNFLVEGTTVTVTPETGTFEFTLLDDRPDGKIDGLRLDYSDATNDFHVIYSVQTLERMIEYELQPGAFGGSYLYGGPLPADPDRASINVYGNGESVASTVAIINIYELVIDHSGPTPTLAKLHSDFLFQPDEGPTRALNGKLSYAYSPPLIADTIVENPNEGLDTIRSTASYSLPAHVENLTLIGTTDIDGTGNALDNVLEGNSAANTLSGGAGADRLTGGAGSDRFDYNALTEGFDTITDFTLGAGGDVLDIRDVLVGYTAGSSDIDDFVQLTGGASTTMSVNADGIGSDFVALATLQNVAMTGSLLNDMVANGNLVAA